MGGIVLEERAGHFFPLRPDGKTKGSIKEESGLHECPTF